MKSNQNLWKVETRNLWKRIKLEQNDRFKKIVDLLCVFLRQIDKQIIKAKNLKKAKNRSTQNWISYYVWWPSIAWLHLKTKIYKNFVKKDKIGPDVWSYQSQKKVIVFSFYLFIFFCHSFNEMTIINFKCLYNTETAEEKNVKNVNFKGNRNNTILTNLYLHFSS